MEQPKKKSAFSSQSLSDEVLEALQEANSIKRLGDHRDDFLKEIGAVADDNTKTKAIFIYWAYLKWCSKRNISPIHRKSFYRGFNKLFKHKLKRLNFYYIRSPAFIISKEEKKLMLQHLKEENEYYKWQRKKRKQLKEYRQKKRLKRKQKKLLEEVEELIRDSKKPSSQK